MPSSKNSADQQLMKILGLPGLPLAGDLEPNPRRQEAPAFKIGDHVGWNSEAGRVSGRIIRIHQRDFDWKGYTHHASAGDPQYEIRSDKTEHVAVHKGKALTRIDG